MQKKTGKAVLDMLQRYMCGWIPDYIGASPSWAAGAIAVLTWAGIIPRWANLTAWAALMEWAVGSGAARMAASDMTSVLRDGE